MYNSFSDMPVWQNALKISEKIFQLSNALPKSEDYGLTSQIRRSANSVNSNIAEGFGRRTNKDKSNFYVMARGSCTETQSHLLYGKKVNYFDIKEVEELFDNYSKLIHELNKIIKALRG